MVTTGTQEPLVYSIVEAGRLLGISRPSAYKLVADGTIKSLQLGRRKVVPKIALMRMLEAGNGSAPKC